jgi:hypothetical protein
MAQEPKPADVIAQARKQLKDVGRSYSAAARATISEYFKAWASARGSFDNRKQQALAKMTADSNRTPHEEQDYLMRCRVAQGLIDNAFESLSGK